MPADFVEKVVAYGEHVGSVNLWALGLGTATVVFLVLWPRVNPRIPSPLVAMVRAGILARVGEENLVPDFRRPVERSKEILGAPAVSGR